MITKQQKEHLKILMESCCYEDDEAEDELSYLFNLLTKEQRIALVKELGLSVVEWVDFDVDDERTWPEYGNYLLDSSEGIVKGVFHSWGDTFQSNTTGNDIGMDGFEVYAYCGLPQRIGK